MPNATASSDGSDSSRNIYQRLAKAMESVSYIQKQKGGGLQYSVVTHDSVTAAVRPALLAVGVIYFPTEMAHVQNGNRTEVTLKVRFVNIDNPEDCIEVPAIGYGIDQQDKGPGKAVSYAVKYALLKAMGLETGDDPDLHQKVVHVQTAPDGTPIPSLEEAVASCADSIATIKAGIESGDLSVASEAWQELTGGEKMALWVAPTKGGPFTTAERSIIKSTEFRLANGVEA